MKVYTPEEFEELMRNCVIDNYYDQEDMHIEMDNLMCDVLRMLGYGEGVKIFEDTPKWYS